MRLSVVPRSSKPKCYFALPGARSSRVCKADYIYRFDVDVDLVFARLITLTGMMIDKVVA